MTARGFYTLLAGCVLVITALSVGSEGAFLLGCAALLAYAAWRLEKRKKRLREEGSLFE